MADREKVIKGLEACLDEADCTTCYKDGPWFGYACRESLMRDALVALKEQKAIKPYLDVDEWKCGNCGHDLEHQELLGENVLFHEQYNYCPQCGKAVKWRG